jgi:hypothetical protein
MCRSIGKRPLSAKQASADVDLNDLKMSSAISVLSAFKDGDRPYPVDDWAPKRAAVPVDLASQDSLHNRILSNTFDSELTTEIER